MICVRHSFCRDQLRGRVVAWPLATYPRAFVVTVVGVLWIFVLLGLLVLDVAVLVWALLASWGLVW